MGVVRGDRTAESQKLNRCSAEAQDFYGRFVAVVPDDFGRFRCSVGHVFVRMYPRREPTPGALRRVSRLMAELEREKLWKKWVVDGVEFAELTGWPLRVNRWHRTPEPPSTNHAHTASCLATAISRAREWGDINTAITLSNRLKELRVAQALSSTTGTTNEQVPEPPSSVPSVPLLTETDITAVPAVRAATQPALFPPPKPVKSKRSVAVTRVRTTGPLSWNQEAGEDWRERFGGTVPWARITNALKQLVTELSWPVVRPPWRSYLARADGTFVSPEKFAQTFNDWKGQRRGRQPTMADRNREATEEWVADLGEEDGK